MGGSEVGRSSADEPRQDAEVRGAPPEPQLPPEEFDERILRALAKNEQEIVEHMLAIEKDVDALREAVAEYQRDSEDVVSNLARGTARGVAIALGTQAAKAAWQHFIKPLLGF